MSYEITDEQIAEIIFKYSATGIEKQVWFQRGEVTAIVRAILALAAPAVLAESWMLDKAEWIADEFGASNDSKETREAHAAAIVEAMQAASKGVPAAQSAEAAKEGKE